MSTCGVVYFFIYTGMVGLNKATIDNIMSKKEERFVKLPPILMTPYEEDRLYGILKGMAQIEAIEEYFNVLERDSDGKILPYDRMSVKGKEDFDEFNVKMGRAKRDIREGNIPECCEQRLDSMCFEVFTLGNNRIDSNFGVALARRLIREGRIEEVFENRKNFGLESVYSVCKLCIDEGKYDHIMDNFDEIIEYGKKKSILYDVIKLGGSTDIINYFKRKGKFNLIPTNKSEKGCILEMMRLMCIYSSSISEVLDWMDDMKAETVGLGGGKYVNKIRGSRKGEGSGHVNDKAGNNEGTHGNFEESLLSKIISDNVLRLALETGEYDFLGQVQTGKHKEDYQSIYDRLKGQSIPFEGSLLEKILNNYLYYLELEKLNSKILDKLRSGSFTFNDLLKLQENGRDIGAEKKYYKWVSTKDLSFVN